jgi:hypothetical protein
MVSASNHSARHGLCLPSVIVAIFFSACSHQGLGGIDQHYHAFGARPPENNTISVCSAYGCRVQTKFKFTGTDVTSLQKLMRGAKKTAAAIEEREAIGLTLAWMEKRVGDVVGTAADRPGDDLAGAGDPTQMDCVDVATNLTSYLLVLQSNGLLKHHAVGDVFIKEDITRGFSGWTHYAAVISDVRSGQRYAVDGWKLASGIAPEIVEVEKWYIDDKDIKFSL